MDTLLRPLAPTAQVRPPARPPARLPAVLLPLGCAHQETRLSGGALLFSSPLFPPWPLPPSIYCSGLIGALPCSVRPPQAHT